MTKIFLGPAGIPTITKGGTVEGIKDVAKLGLNAMEIEFVRGVKMGNDLAKECGKVANELGIRLSIHAPYYINLSSNENEKIEASKKRILDSAEKGYLMGANVVVFHAGYYGKLTEEETYKKIKKACEEMLDQMKAEGWNDVLLGLETTGKVSQWGTPEEIIKLCKELKGVTPVIDFAHIYARNVGRIDYGEILDKFDKLELKHVYCHFSCIEYSPVGMTGKGNERYHLTLDKKKPDFEALAKEILKRKMNITIISESPILERDSLVMKKIFEKLGYKF